MAWNEETRLTAPKTKFEFFDDFERHKNALSNGHMPKAVRSKVSKFVGKKKPEIEFEKSLENESEKVILYKWTGICERCYQRGHKPMNYTAAKPNKKFVE